MTMDGGCQCGAVRYRIDGDVVTLAVCHCKNCQRQSGSAFGMSLMVRAEAFILLQGELKTFVMRCDSGRLKDCAFCPECGSRIHHNTRDGILSIKAGTLDDTSALDPHAHYWTAFKQRWFAIPEASRCFADDG